MERESGLFNRNELPGAAADRPSLKPITAVSDDEVDADAKGDAVARLGVAAKGSVAGSGLIDLGAVARDLQQRKSDPSPNDPRPMMPGGIIAEAASVDPEQVAKPPQTRGLLLASIGLLVVLIGLLGYLASN